MKRKMIEQGPGHYDQPTQLINHPPTADEKRMDYNHLMLSMLFGSIGAGMFMYGKKAGRMVALGAGLGLIILPYFITNLLVMAIVCCVMMGLPWIIRES